MKLYPLRSKEIFKRPERKSSIDWTMVVWNDGSRSYRRIYYSFGEKFIMNKGCFYKMFWNEQFKYFNFKKVEKSESEKLSKEFSKEAEEEEFVKEVASEVKKEVLENGFVEYNKDPIHPAYKNIKKCVEAGIPVYLVGPAGTGKNYSLQKIADELNLEFYYANSVQDEFKLTGFIDAAGDYQETEFYKAFTEGGLFFLDEMDASIPSVLVLLNAAIANGYFSFPNGKKFQNENFRVVAAGNTFGNGADENYTGRMVLDAASLDRFATFEYNYSYDVELSLAKGNKWLVDFVEELRNIAEKNGIRATFSYRCIQMASKMEEVGFTLKDIYKAVMFKGMDKETIKYFRTENNSNKYEKALYEMIA